MKMNTSIYTFQLDLDFEMINHMSAIDRFGGEWTGIAKREGVETLKQLKSIATVSSVGSSTRIEGARMTDDEVKTFIFDQLKIGKLEERDHQEVLGYFKVLDIISETHSDIEINESNLKSLHNLLMKYSDKDQWHKGNYKQHINSVEATNSDGTKIIVFEATPPGIETEDAMRKLVEWYSSESNTPLLLKTAIFVYDFLSIHPFQDGNGRMSRLLGTLLLLKNGYPWIEYVSFEHEIENRKGEYYGVLMDCQQRRPGENITTWIHFFLDCMTNIQQKLKGKLDSYKRENQLVPREKIIYRFVESHPGCSSGEISKKLEIPLPTVKRILSTMASEKFLVKHGNGAGTTYTAETLIRMRYDLAYTFTEAAKSKEFIFLNRYAVLSIKKIILYPKFQWQKPDEWAAELFEQQLQLKVIGNSRNGRHSSQHFFIGANNTPFHYQPVFSLDNPIELPSSLLEREANDNEYPIRVVIEVVCSASTLKFDVMIVYDQSSE